MLLALASALTYVAFLLAPSQTALQRMSIATAYSSLILLALVLMYVAAVEFGTLVSSRRAEHLYLA